MCNKTYTCIGDTETGFVWKADVEDGVKGKAGCKIDSLVAGGIVNNCETGHVKVPTKCDSKDPCLITSSSENTFKCFSSRGSNGMPNSIDAGWTCTSKQGIYNPRNYEAYKFENFGSLVTMDVSAKPVSGVNANVANVKEIEKPKDGNSLNRLFGSNRTIVPVKSNPRIDPSGVKNDSPTTTSKSVSGKQTYAKRDSEFADMIASVPDKKTLSSNENSTESNLYTCDWFRKKTSISCETQEDCVSQDEYFDTWYNNVARGGYTKLSRRTFGLNPFKQKPDRERTVRYLEMLQGSDTFKSNEFLTWSDEAVGKLKDVEKACDLRVNLKSLYNSDPTFQHSVKEYFKHNGELNDKLPDGVGVCSQVSSQFHSARKQCSRTNKQKTPSLNLFDGKTTLQFYETDDGVKYSRGEGGGSMKTLRAESCNPDENPTPPEECRMEDTHVIETSLLEGVKQPPKLGRGDPIRKHYRVNFKLDDNAASGYILHNRIHSEANTEEEGKIKCAERLCARNSDQCPAPHCVKQGGGCIPDPHKGGESVIVRQG
jgi:hypothetical protein